MDGRITVTIELNAEDIERIEQFRANSIRVTSVHGTRESTEAMRQMQFEKLAQICFKTILAKDEALRKARPMFSKF